MYALEIATLCDTDKRRVCTFAQCREELEARELAAETARMTVLEERKKESHNMLVDVVKSSLGFKQGMG